MVVEVGSVNVVVGVAFLCEGGRKVVVGGGCWSPELVVGVGRAKVVVRVCSQSCFVRRWSLVLVAGVLIGGGC